MSRFVCFICSLLLAGNLLAGEGYKISVQVEGFEGKEAYLGYHFGDKQYIQDTVSASNGSFVFEGEESLKGGLYLIILPPDNDYFQVLINEGEQNFSVKTKVGKLADNLVVKGSPDNELFLEYLGFLSSKRPEADALNTKLREAVEAKDDATKESLQKQIGKINEEVLAFQKRIIEEQSTTLTAAIIKANIAVDTPEFSGTDAELNRWQYTKKHFFDNLDMADSRLLRSPVQFGKVDYYIQKLTVQHPDSIANSIDYVLDLVKPSEETFKFYLIHFLNAYAKSKIVGMDAIYVHLAEKYYATGQASWTEEEQVTKIVENAKTLKPLLIGKTAPDINCKILDVDATLKLKENEDIHQRFKTSGSMSLYDVDAPYTVLFIWAPDCGHCKKSMPKMIEFYDEFSAKGVEVYAVCSKFVNGLPECAEFLDERRDMLKWINVVDPYHESKYKELYDVRSTPQVYVLDANKEIILKRVGAEQLKEVMAEIIEKDKKQK